MKFVRFHEYNDHEGEQWDFWLQLDGNEEEINALAWRLRDAEEECDGIGGDFNYTLDRNDIEPEFIVDKLVEYGQEGYMSAHTKVTGKFTCPNSLGDYEDDLYKGGITEFFTEETNA